MKSNKSEPSNALMAPAVAMPLEVYSLRRRAEFLLNNVVNAEDYRRAVREVRKLGINPEGIPHRKP